MSRYFARIRRFWAILHRQEALDVMHSALCHATLGHAPQGCGSACCCGLEGRAQHVDEITGSSSRYFRPTALLPFRGPKRPPRTRNCKVITLAAWLSCPGVWVGSVKRPRGPRPASQRNNRHDLSLLPLQSSSFFFFSVRTRTHAELQSFHTCRLVGLPRGVGTLSEVVPRAAPGLLMRKRA